MTVRPVAHRAVLAGAALLAAAGMGYLLAGPAPRGADPANAAQVLRGKTVYAEHCAACHGAALQGQPDWQRRGANGRLPAPPHDASGHTWHHSDRQLFQITKYGLAPIAGPAYATDMPAFADQLGDDDIWAVLAFIKSRWPADIAARQDSRNQ